MSKGVEVAHSWGVRKEEAGYHNTECVGCKQAACRSLHPGFSFLGSVPPFPLVPVCPPTSGIPGISILSPSRVGSRCCADLSFLREQRKQHLPLGSCDQAWVHGMGESPTALGGSQMPPASHWVTVAAFLSPWRATLA